MVDAVEQLNLLKQEIWFNSSELRDYELERKETKENAALFYYTQAKELMQKDYSFQQLQIILLANHYMNL